MNQEDKRISRMVDSFADSVFVERIRQETLRKAGKFKTDCSNPKAAPHENLAVLAEEFGEVAKEVCEFLSTGHMSSNLEKELIQVAAVACAWWEGVQKAQREFVGEE